MRILVCGSRHFNDFYLASNILLEHFTGGPGFTLIHGDAKGADRLSERVIRHYFYKLDDLVSIERYPADWEKHGKAAGHIRNKQMLDEGKPDLVIAFLAKDSKGTKNMIDQATKAGVPVKVIDV